ncbi:MAG: hypothetical protein SF172_17990 [Burkholderiales bacterium]|nr:hypothetical protein [Burkholderiales bacterium]
MSDSPNAESADQESIQALLAEARAALDQIKSEATTNANSFQEKCNQELQNLRDAIQAINEAAGSAPALRDEIGAMQLEARQEHHNIIAYAEKVEEQLQAANERISTLAAEFQAAFSAAQEERIKEFAASEASRQEKFNAASADQQTQFTSAQSDRQDKHSAFMAEQTNKLNEQQNKFIADSDEIQEDFIDHKDRLKKSYEEKAQAILNKIEGHKAEVENLLGVIGNMGVSSGYLKTANSARKSLWIWQGVTVASMVALIIIAFKAFSPTEGMTFSWEWFASRMALFIPLGVLAAYSASQADKAHKSEQKNRALSLELEALGPYLAPLPQEEQNKFRVEIGHRSFGQATKDSVGSDEKSPATVVDAFNLKENVQEMKELATSIVDAVKGKPSP